MSLHTQLTQADTFFCIAGPCVIEKYDIMMQIAETLRRLTDELQIPYVFKASYTKANRTSYGSPTGPGLDAGLRILEQIKEQFDLPILTDIHQTNEIEAVSQVADILQIPAFLSRQTELIVQAAATGDIINIKKGQFMAPEDMDGALLKAASTGNTKLFATERGASFGYHNLVVDFRGFITMAALGYPVIYDVTHSLQRPSIGTTSGGNPELARPMAQAALATGCVDGLFIETHPTPQTALSDAKTMIPLSEMRQLLTACIPHYKLAKEHHENS